MSVQRHGTVAVSCPHCNAHQYEPVKFPLQGLCNIVADTHKTALKPADDAVKRKISMFQPGVFLFRW